MATRRGSADNPRTDAAAPHDLSAILTPPAWTVDALCTQFPPDMFYPDGAGWSGTEAKAVCAMCPVVEQCLQYALAFDGGDLGAQMPYAHGVWGGKSPTERRRMLREAAPDQEPAA